MNLRAYVRETWASLRGGIAVVQARIIPTWQAGRPLTPMHDIAALAEEGYRRNILMAACIWSIATSASEPLLVVKRRKKDGTTEVATGADAQALRALLESPNPEHSTFTFLERLFTHQQIAGIWFCRKLRAAAGNVVQVWPMNPALTRVIPGDSGWVKSYKYEGVKGEIPAEDVVSDMLHPDPKDDFWGLSPIAVAARFVDIDNQAADFLRSFFLNNATPAGILKLKARMEPAERQRLREVWTKEHTGSTGWNSISVLDADAEYQDIGSSPGTKMAMTSIWDVVESRLCMAFGVPPIVVGAVLGLNRSTYANFAEARKSFWQDTLAPLYKRCGQALTKGVAREFAEDLVIEFDLSTVEALQEHRDSKRGFALAGYAGGLLTLNQALELVGLPPVDDTAGGGARKVTPTPSGFGGLLLSRGEQHARKVTSIEKTARRQFRSTMVKHFGAQRVALIKHLEE